MSEPTKTDLVDVQIDGVWHQFPKGTRVIEACRQVGVEVPHYCYHPKLSSPGNCRMCLVQMGMPPRPAPGAEPPAKDETGHLPLSWSPRPIIACANTVSPNMGIRTKGELVEGCRKGVLEFLLANHPLDCPICDKAGECALQEYSIEHGAGESRFRERKVKKPKNVDVGPRIRLDDERCIMCSRCIRFMDEVADEPVLGFTDRGSHVVLAVYPGHELDSNYSMNTVDICPVGALTSNDFRFQMRVWFTRETKTIDTNCATGCNITVYSRENRIYRVVPRRNNEVNSDWMPDSHRLSFHWIDGENRLSDPMLKAEGGHRVTTWTETLATAAKQLGEFKPEQIGIVASARLTNEELFVLSRLAQHLGVESIATVPREGKADPYLISADRNPNTNGARLILGESAVEGGLKRVQSAIEEGAIKALLVFQEDLVEDAGFSADTLDKLDFLLVAHSQANATTQGADALLPAACWAELSGSMINSTGRLQRLNKAIEAPGQSMAIWEITRDLLRALGSEDNCQSVTEIFRKLAAEVPTFQGVSWGQIGDLGLPLIDTGVKIPLLEREKERIAQGIIVG